MIKGNVMDALMGASIANSLAGSQLGNVQNNVGKGDTFSDVLNMSSAKTENVSNDNQKQPQKSLEVNKTSNKVSETKQETPKKTELQGEEKTDAYKVVKDKAEEIVSEIKEKFDLTDEDIEKAMETLGLAFVDLFNPNDLKNLLMTVTGTEDSVELLTNVDLYEGMTDVVNLMNQLSEEIQGELNLTKEGFNELINDKESFAQFMTLEDTKGNENKIPVPALENEDIDESSAIESLPKQNNNFDNELNIANDNASEKIDVEQVQVEKNPAPADRQERKIEVEVNIEKDVTSVSNEAIEKIVTDKDLSKNSDSESRGKNSNMFDENGFNLNGLADANANNTVADVVEAVESYSSVADAEEIMRQVTDSIKVNISANETSMEMNLHPASLGTVNMQVVSNNGQVTAHFTVQNEAVKAVLETQLLTLQESLNEAGTKVNAIEVTVAGYNLDKGADGDANQGNSGNSQSSRRRGINLNALDSFDDLTDEELVEAEMMEMNGNTVNFRA